MVMRYKRTGPVYPLLAGEPGVAKLARENHFQLNFADMVPNLPSGKLGIYCCPFQLKTFS